MHAERPAHVPENLVVDFDLYAIPGSEDDVHLAFRRFQQNGPDIFWTPHNGGHWVATRAEDIEVMQRDHERFSHRRITIPVMPPDSPRQLPLELDPPEHNAYRKPLTFALLPKVVATLEDKVRQTAIDLIEGLQPRGKCEFVADFAKVLPIVVFLDLVDLPREDRHYLLPITEDSVRGSTVEVRGAAHRAVGAYLQRYITARREKPGSDLLSILVNTEVDGQRIGLEEATAFATLVLFGGLDTVAGMLGFIARFLATHPEHRDDIAAHLGDESFLRNAIEELVRVHGLANTARIVTRDFAYKGIDFRAGDAVLPANLFVGLDDRRIKDPLTVDFRRPAPAPHATFGNGPHICPGAILARREIKIFLQEWLRRIPVFEIELGTKPVLVTGMVNGVLELRLRWPVT